MVLDGLLRGLVQNGANVELFTLGRTNYPDVKNHHLYHDEQYKHIHRPMYESLPILAAHFQWALNYIVEDGGFDVIHDHNGFYGPQMLAFATAHDKSLPPAVFTHHGPPFTNDEMLKQGLPDNRPYWRQVGRIPGSRAYVVGISETLMKTAPRELRKNILPPVYNAVNIDDFEFSAEKDDYFLTLARFSREKGEHVAAKICDELGYRLKMAGTVASIATNRQLMLEMANPLSHFRNADDFRYYSDEILPFTINNSDIQFVGNISGVRKQRLISRAKALLFPIDWEEPFGMAVIEAMACGTPVVAMNRGAMGEIIEHGRNGFLAENEDEFAKYMQRVDEIDPAQCRLSVEEKFSSQAMAAAYIDRYKMAIAREPITVSELESELSSIPVRATAGLRAANSLLRV